MSRWRSGRGRLAPLSVTTRTSLVMPWAAKKARARQKKPIVVETFSTVQGLGVGQTREAVDGGVQVGVANPGALASFGGFGPWVFLARGPASLPQVGCVGPS